MAAINLLDYQACKICRSLNKQKVVGQGEKKTSFNVFLSVKSPAVILPTAASHWPSLRRRG